VLARLDAAPAWQTSLLVAVPLLVIYLLTATYAPPLSPDPRAASIPAWTLAQHGTLSVDGFEREVRWTVEVDGRTVSNRQPGVIAVGVPFYLLAPRTEEPSMAPGTVAAVLATVAAMVVLHLLFRRLVRPGAAVLGALVAGLATSTWSVSADALWPHGPNQLWLGLGLLGMAATQHWPAGLAFAAAILTRPNLAIVPAVSGLWAAWERRTPRPALVVGATSALGVVGLLAYNAAVFGEPTLGGGYPDAFADRLTTAGPSYWGMNVLGTLFSPDRGILVLSPWLLLLVPGLVRAWRCAPDWVRAGAVGGVLYLLLQLRMNRFSGGNNFFGYRYPLEMLTLAGPLLLLAWREWTAVQRWRRLTFAALAAVSFAVHGLGATAFVLPFADRSPWRNCNVCEAATAAGTALTAAWVVAAAVLLALVVAAERRAAGPQRARPRTSERG
jgi:hypothetical protein